MQRLKPHEDVEKSRKQAHRETIAKANLDLLKKSIDRSAGFRTTQITQDQKTIYRRFQNKLLITQLNFARMYGDKAKFREVKEKMTDMKIIENDDEYDFFRKLTGDAARERKKQRSSKSARTTSSKRSDSTQLVEILALSDDDDRQSDEDGYTTTATITDTASPNVTKRSNLRVGTQSARLSNESNSGPRAVKFKDVRPESQQNPRSTVEDDGRSQSCLPNMPDPTIRKSSSGTELAPPSYDVAEIQAVHELSTLNQKIEKQGETIFEVAKANLPARTSKSAVSRAVASSTKTDQRPITATSRPQAHRGSTASNIFVKKSGPTKYEVHAEWLRRRNYQGVVNEFCESLFYVPEPEPEPVLPQPEPVKEEEAKPKQPVLRGSRRVSVIQKNLEEQNQAITPVGTTEPKKAPPPLAIATYDYSSLYHQDMENMASHSRRAPILEIIPDPSDFKREAGNIHLRNITMPRVNYY